MTDPPSKTALILIDPYNDFIHPQGKIYSALADSLQKTDTIAHIFSVVAAARAAHIPIYYGLHQPYKPGTYDGWKHMTPSHAKLKENKVFEEGSWGAEILKGLEPDLGNGDVIVSKHWNSSSFQNTDLDFQLHQREITHLVLAGLVSNTCVESTARYAYELGYHVTLLTDATAAFSIETHSAATEICWPLFAQAVVTAGEWIARLQQGRNVSREEAVP